MNCALCGSVMIEKAPTTIYTSNPPQWDCIMWCGCGHTVNLGRVFAKSEEQRLRDEWEAANRRDAK